MRRRAAAAALLVLGIVALFASAAAAATEITDSAVDQRLSQAESAFRQGRPDEATRLLNDVTSWANHIRDIRAGMRDPAADAAFAERIYQRVLATVGRTFGADHVNAWDALVGLATLYREQQRYAASESLLLRALSVVQQAAGPPDRKQFGEGRVLLDLAALYEVQGKNAPAEAAYRRAADLFDNAGPRFARNRDEALARCARLLRASGRPAEAAALEGRMLPQHRAAAARKAVEEAWEAAGTAQRAGRAAEADRILQGAVREAEASGDPDLARRALVMLAFYYKQAGRTADLQAVCRRITSPGPPC